MFFALLQSSQLILNAGVLCEWQQEGKGGKKGLQLKFSIFLVVEQNNLNSFIITALTVAGLVSGRSPPNSIREISTQQILGLDMCKSVNQ